MDNPITAVRSRNLIELARSNGFRQNLAKAARITMRTGRETAFLLLEDSYKSRRVLTPVVEGHGDAVDPTDPLLYEADEFPDAIFRAGTYTILDVHFHPEFNEPLAISRSDLQGLQSQVAPHDLGEVFPLAAIGTVDDTGVGTLLFLQLGFDRPTGGRYLRSLNEAYAHLRSIQDWRSADLASRIESCGVLRAGILDFTVAGTRTYAGINNPAVLGRFRDYLAWPTAPEKEKCRIPAPARYISRAG